MLITTCCHLLKTGYEKTFIASVNDLNDLKLPLYLCQKLCFKIGDIYIYIYVLCLSKNDRSR